MRGALDNDVPAPSSIAAVRSSSRYVLFTAETYATPSPVSSFDPNSGLIYKFHPPDGDAVTGVP